MHMFSLQISCRGWSKLKGTNADAILLMVQRPYPAISTRISMIIAATGHRPDKLGGYDPLVTKRLLALATHALQRMAPDEVITGMALGWDTAIAQAALNLNIPYRAYIPFIGQEQVWPSANRLYYKELLDRAKIVVVCSGGGYSKRAMQERNERMVDHCDKLAVLWDGTSGGTANCLSYATFLQKPYINFWFKFFAEKEL